jgi:hypothetical protein
MGQSSSSQPGKHTRPRGLCGVEQLPPDIAIAIARFSDLKTDLEDNMNCERSGGGTYSASVALLRDVAQGQEQDMGTMEYDYLTLPKDAAARTSVEKNENLDSLFLGADSIGHGRLAPYSKAHRSEVYHLRSASLDDLSYIALYLKQNDQPPVLDCANPRPLLCCRLTYM